MANATRLLYQSDTYLWRATASVMCFRMMEGGTRRALLVLDQTIFYPQGGGQPSDIGIIRSCASDAVLNVSMVKFNPETLQVEHEGSLSEDGRPFEECEGVELILDVPTRMLHARLHSAGHLMDHAADLLGLNFQVLKGYHFSDGPYVEYRPLREDQDFSPEKLPAFKSTFEKKCLELVADSREIIATTVEPEQLPSEIFDHLPEKAKSAPIVRLIHFAQCPPPRPCGGTHVRNTAELEGFSIKKVTFKKGVLRISYAIPTGSQ